MFITLNFIDQTIDPALALAAHYDLLLVLTSVVIASLASYTAFALAERARAAGSPSARTGWLLSGAVALGTGTWTMHFLGMLAYRLPIPVSYDVPLTALSMIPALLAGAAALYVVTHREKSKRHFILGGIVMGSGIGVMHYVGMAALRMDAIVYYDPYLFGASVVIAVVCAIGALKAKSLVADETHLSSVHILIIGAALIMGFAISAMHYTGMAATYCFAEPGGNLGSAGADSRYLAISISAMTMIILALLIVASRIGQRLELIPRLEREIAERRKVESELLDSEERFRAFINHLPAKMHIKDPDGRYLLINPMSEKLFGITNTQAIGKTAADIFPEHMGETFGAHDERVLSTGIAHTEEELFLSGDGPRTFLTVKFPLRDAKGDIVAIGGSGIEITERKRAEEALQQAHDELELRIHERTKQLQHEVEERKYTARQLQISEQRFRDIAESSSDWFWEMGPDLKFTFVSESFREIAGMDPQSLIGKTRGELTSEVWNGHLDDLNNRRSFRNFQYEMQAPDGSALFISISGKPVFDEDGAFKGYRGTGTNITERKKAEAALQKALEEAGIANRAKSDLMANMSHELRTPLNAIIGFSGMMQEEVFGPIGDGKYREYLADIHNSGQHLLDLINDILDVSAIEAGALELREENVSPAEVVEAAVRLIRPRADKGEVAIASTVDPDLPPIYADERRIKQVLLNLLSNAVKFTPEGGNVSVSAWLNDNGTLAVTVSDTGIGMDEQELATALSKFGQVDSSLDRKHEGTGLGLPLTMGLIELHGGTMDIVSEKGRGTEITVTFPKDRIGRNAG